MVLGAQYDKSSTWKSQRQRRNDEAAFTFSDVEGKFSAFLMRLDGLPGNAQGYTRLVYHLDVKVTEYSSFEITQGELDRVRHLPPACYQFVAMEDEANRGLYSHRRVNTRSTASPTQQNRPPPRTSPLW